MSKVVRSVTRVIGKVVNGIGRLAEKITGSKTIGKLAKFAAMAATVYFGGAAIAGVASGAGAVAGLQGAWTSLGTAGSALMAGNISGAGTALASGMSGTAMTGAQLASSQVAGATAAAGLPPVDYGLTAGSKVVGSGSGIAAVPSAASTVAPSVAPQAAPGLLAKIAESPYTAPALIQGTGMIFQSLAQGRQLDEAQKRQERLTDEERKRYNTNVGTRLWG